MKQTFDGLILERIFIIIIGNACSCRVSKSRWMNIWIKTKYKGTGVRNWSRCCKFGENWEKNAEDLLIELFIRVKC
jgi:hypothetical protein